MSMVDKINKRGDGTDITTNLNSINKRSTCTKIKFSNSTTFLAACACSDYEECERLLSQNLVNINCTNIDGLTALHQACIDDNAPMVKFLLDHGADVNFCDNEGWTPLHATASCGNKNVARLLLDHDADPRIVNNDGELSQDLTDNFAIKDIIDAKLKELGVTDVEALRKQEENCMLRDVNNWIQTGIVEDKVHPRTGATILHVAAAKGYIDVLSAILNNKILRSQVDPNARDNENWTPLAAACYWQHSGAVQLLLLHGADVNVETISGQRLEDLTDHDLILKLIEEKRLAEERKRKEQLKEQIIMNSPQSKVPSSPSSALSPISTESETQRKAHAKRIRETRRSTTGVSTEDIKQAKEQFKKVTITPISSIGPISSSISPISSSIGPISSSINPITSMPYKTSRPSLEDGKDNKDVLDSPTNTEPMVMEVSQDTINYKQINDNLVADMDNLKKEYHFREHEWNREKRKLERKVSELEEEIKQLESLRDDHRRIKEENIALIRVISKLSK